jgi:hypothetical protein
VLNTRHFSLSGDYPDLNSGYKIYSRRVCELMVERPWEHPPWVGPEINQYGVEAVPFIEGVLAGAIVGEISRLTREPEFTGHTGFTRPEKNGAVLLWTFLRLEIQVSHAAALLDNHIPRLTLWTDPEGRESLLQLRRVVLEKLPQTTQQPASSTDVKAGFYF